METVNIRPPRPNELPQLQGRLAAREKDGYEQFPLLGAIVFVAEDYDGLLAGMVAMRLRMSPWAAVPMWQIEPLILFPGFIRNSPAHAQRKATYLLAKAAEGYITDRSRNTTGVRSFFCHIEQENYRMHGLAEHIGWLAVPGTFYAKVQEA